MTAEGCAADDRADEVIAWGVIHVNVPQALERTVETKDDSCRSRF
jgi:hypothetical protein